MISLTFDDGPGPTTNKILDLLELHGQRATFFLIGEHMEHPRWSSNVNAGWEISTRMLLNGHVIGNHTYQHKGIYGSEKEFVSDVTRVDRLIEKLYFDQGRSIGHIPFRLPFGVGTQDKRLNYLSGMGKTHNHWSQDFDDWHEGEIKGLTKRMLEYVAPREAAGLDSVLDLHDAGIGNKNGYARDATANALGELLQVAAKEGWKFSPLPV